MKGITRFKRVRGTQDILPQEAIFWQELESKARKLFSLYRYEEIRTPLLEEAALFNRSLGEASEVVQKQMFELEHGSSRLALRPEATAALVRAYLENNLSHCKSLNKLYYLGPMFRAERPQKGRLRQFHHIGIEAIGALSPLIDVEVISLGAALLRSWGINSYQLFLNSLGCAADKKKLGDLLRRQLKNKLSKLCVDCQDRFQRNIFRILDCKNPLCQQALSSLQISHSHLCHGCLEHFQQACAGLDAIGLVYSISESLVRGLDYYTRTVFEFKHASLGAQDALGAGGRYDNLIEQLGGSPQPAIGFAFGIERVILAKDKKIPAAGSKPWVYLIALSPPAEQEACRLLAQLRAECIPADMDYLSRSLKAQMRQANDLGSRYCVIIGENELAKGRLTLKDMQSGEQQELSQQQIISKIKD